MLELSVGCTVMHGDQEVFFNVEMQANSYPSIEHREELKAFLNENTIEIVDDVRYIIDMTTAELIWEAPQK